MLRLRTRLLLAYLAALIPLAVGFGWGAYVTARAGLEAELGRSLSNAASMVAADFSAGSAAGRIARLEADSDATRARLVDDMETARDAAGLRRVRVVDPELRTLLDTSDFTPFEPAFALEGDRTEIDRVLDDGTPRSSVLFYAADGAPTMRGYALVRDEAPVGLVVVEGDAHFFALLDRFRVQVFLFGGFVLLFVVVITILVSRRITAPLSRLQAAAGRIREGDYATPIPEAGDDEIGTLSTALRQMQEGLAAREEEAQMMLAGIAHEVRNPLGGMELFVGLLEESLDAQSEAAEHAAKVRRELNYLGRVVEEFLLYARERPLEWRRQPALALFEGVRENAAGLEERGVELRLDVTPPDLEISGDIDALRGVLLNVVQNAAQASADGATIALEASADGRGRRIEVRDHGTGMSEEVRSQVLRPFYTTRQKGTGLGLPLARKIVERHGGTLSIRSAPGQGTTVVLELPFRPGAAPIGGERGGMGLDSSDWDGEMIG